MNLIINVDGRALNNT